MPLSRTAHSAGCAERAAKGSACAHRRWRQRAAPRIRVRTPPVRRRLCAAERGGGAGAAARAGRGAGARPRPRHRQRPRCRCLHTAAWSERCLAHRCLTKDAKGAVYGCLCSVPAGGRMWVQGELQAAGVKAQHKISCPLNETRIPPVCRRTTAAAGSRTCDAPRTAHSCCSSANPGSAPPGGTRLHRRGLGARQRQAAGAGARHGSAGLRDARDELRERRPARVRPRRRLRGRCACAPPLAWSAPAPGVYARVCLVSLTLQNYPYAWLQRVHDMREVRNGVRGGALQWLRRKRARMRATAHLVAPICTTTPARCAC